MGLVKLLRDALVHHDELDGLTWNVVYEGNNWGGFYDS